jgi:hypothetical protein
MSATATLPTTSALASRGTAGITSASFHIRGDDQPDRLIPAGNAAVLRLEIMVVVGIVAVVVAADGREELIVIIVVVIHGPQAIIAGAHAVVRGAHLFVVILHFVARLAAPFARRGTGGRFSATFAVARASFAAATAAPASATWLFVRFRLLAGRRSAFAPFGVPIFIQHDIQLIQPIERTIRVIV